MSGANESRDSGWRKLHGVFYTPRPIAQALTDWSLRHRGDRLLDPSFGGCDFIHAGVVTLGALGSAEPIAQICGADTDADAFGYLQSVAGDGYAGSGFRLADFLRLRPRDFPGGRFEAIVGNPPYVRHHSLSAEALGIAQRTIAQQGYKIPRSAGYWAYFVLHSLAFLKPGGRLAMLLPKALLNAKYARIVRAVLGSRFAETRLILVRERLFRDAQESTVIVLADGWSLPHKSARLAVAAGREEVRKLCLNGVTSGVPVQLGDSCEGWKQTLLPEDADNALRRIRERADVVTLGNIARIRIGVVTGANGFFVLRPSRARTQGIREGRLRPIIGSSSYLRGLAVTADAIDRLRGQDRPCLLLSVGRGRISGALQSYLASEEAAEASTAAKCREREPWYRIRDLRVPNAFLSYVNGSGPRLSLNRAGVLSTNAVHRVWWKHRLSVRKQQLLALSSLTSLTGLSAELCGRSYGGGALKLEPSEAARLLLARPLVPTEGISSHFCKVSQLLGQGAREEATALADKAVLEDCLRLKADDVKALRHGRERLRHLRLPADGSGAAP